MNKSFEKILERLEELKLPFPDNCPSYHGNTDDLIDMTKDIVKEVEEEYNNGWIPCSERLPEDDSYILLSFENFSLPCVGRYEEDEKGGAFYIGDEDVTCVQQDLIVNAWQPLPEPYKEENR